MIDLHALAVQDSHDILNGTLGAGSFSVDLAFNTPAGAAVPKSQTIKGLYDDTSFAINFETNLPATAPKIAVKFHQSDLTVWDGKESLQRWTVGFTNGAGQVVTAEVKDVIPDRSFGDVLLMCVIVDGH